MDLINTALNISIKVINSSETRNDGEFAGVPQGPGLGHSGFFLCVCVCMREGRGERREKGQDKHDPPLLSPLEKWPRVGIVVMSAKGLRA